MLWGPVRHEYRALIIKPRSTGSILAKFSHEEYSKTWLLHFVLGYEKGGVRTGAVLHMAHRRANARNAGKSLKLTTTFEIV